MKDFIFTYCVHKHLDTSKSLRHEIQFKSIFLNLILIFTVDEYNRINKYNN